jgi:DnaK suppressor protein
VAAKTTAKKTTPAKKSASASGRAKAVTTTKQTGRTKPAVQSKSPAARPAKAASTSKPKPAVAAKPPKAAAAGKQSKAATAAKTARPKTAAAAKKEAPKRSATSGKTAAGEASAKRAAGTAKAAAADRVGKKPTVGPYAKDAGFFDEQRTLLLSERAIYSGQAVDLRAEADSLALEREPGDVQFDEESGEGGTVTVDRERNLALSAQASAAVEEIDDALRKIDRKSYGGCERCHQAIPKARLRALPFARLCVACKSGGLSRR